MNFSVWIDGRYYVLSEPVSRSHRDVDATWELSALVRKLRGNDLLPVRQFLYVCGCDVYLLSNDNVRDELARRLADGRASLVTTIEPRARVLQRLTRPGPAPRPPVPGFGPAAMLPAKKKFRLVELVEIVDRGRGTVGTVFGGGGTSSRLPELARRTAIDDAYPQFINLKRDYEGRAKRHAECDRTIYLRARLEWADGSEEPRISKNVKWTIEVVKGPSRTRPLEGRDRAGFAYAPGSPDYKTEDIRKAQWRSGDGWVCDVPIQLSRYAGDRVRIIAELDTADPDADPSASRLSAGPYVVWRKFWYQVTRFYASPIPPPRLAEEAYAQVGAAMLWADDVEWGRDHDVPPPPIKTFYPEWLIRIGSVSDETIVVISDANRRWFADKLLKISAKPVIANLIVGDAVARKSGQSLLKQTRMSRRSQSMTIPIPDPDAMVIAPPPDGHLVRYGWWFIAPWMSERWDWEITHGQQIPAMPRKPPKLAGPITDSDVAIPRSLAGQGRAEGNRITVTLPEDCPDPAVYDIRVNIVVSVYSANLDGFSNKGDSAIVITYNDEYENTVTHELGHVFDLPPGPPNLTVSASLPPHEHVYGRGVQGHEHHGGTGRHCSYDAGKKKPTPQHRDGEFFGGTCVMFHAANNNDSYCPECVPQVRLKSLPGKLT